VTDRIFLAVALDDEVRHGLVAFLGENIATGSFPGKPVRPENWHVTLRFLGETTPTQLERVIAFLDEHRSVPPFSVGFAGLGAFPKSSRATVLWLGIDRGAEEATRVAAVCEEAAVSAGFEPEDRPCHPHVTLARVRPKQDVTGLVDRVPRFPLTQRVEAVTVYRSRLGPAGATYEVVATVPLA
jgi:2'-5' RNA ligase